MDNEMSPAATPSSKETSNRKSLFKMFTILGIILLSIIGIFLSWYTSDIAKKNEQERINADFRESSSNSVNSIINHIDVVMEVLPALADYVHIVGTLSEESFFKYSGNLFERYTSVRSLTWIPKTYKTQIPNLEKDRQEEGFPGYKVHAGKGSQLKNKDEYFPIKYIEFSREHDYQTDDLDLMGMDISSTKEWRDAMEESVIEGEIIFASKKDKPEQIFALLPVYKDGTSNFTKIEREENLIGYVGAFLPGTFLIESGLEKIDDYSRAQVQVSGVVNVTSVDEVGSGLIFYDDAAEQIQSPNSLTNTDTVRMYGKEWNLTTQAKQKFLTEHKVSNFPQVVLFSGLAVTSLIVFSLLSLLTRNTKVEREVKERTNELGQTYEKLRDSEVMLMQSEKMSALGQMVAGVAHELNTPLGYVRSNLQIMQEHFQDLQNLLRKMIETQEPPEGFSKELMQPVKHLLELLDERVDPATMTDVCSDSMDGIDHLSNIVISLKNFSRKDMLEVEKVSVNDCISNSLTIAHSTIKNKAEVITEYGDIPDITCYPSKLNQVFLNIITNAADAIEEFGTLHIRTTSENDEVIISITDTGRGMSDEELKKVFEPFHTTKDVGKGTGLGLFICDRIIDEHGGRIEIRSALEQGSEFIIYLPITLNQTQQKMLES